MSVGKGQVGDEINGKLFEREGGRGLNGGQRRGYGVSADLVLLAYGATSNEVVDEYRQPRPPKVALNDGFGAKMSEMARERGGMDGMKKRGTGGRWYIHSTFIVEMAIVEGPVGEGGTWEEGCILR